MLNLVPIPSQMFPELSLCVNSQETDNYPFNVNVFFFFLEFYNTMQYNTLFHISLLQNIKRYCMASFIRVIIRYLIVKLKPY